MAASRLAEGRPKAAQDRPQTLSALFAAARGAGLHRPGNGASPPLELSLNLAYDLLKGAIDMAYPRSPAPGLPAATGKRGASGAAKPVPAAKSKTGRATSPAGKSKAAERPAAKSAVLAVAKRTPAAVTLARDKATALSCITVYRASPLERIDMIRRGIPASEVKRIFADLSIGQGAGFKALNLSTATVNKKARRGDTLSPEESERIVGFAKLVGQLEAMIQDSGDPANFDGGAWMEGQGLVSAALAKIQSGAYA
jgi:uncharacterized protein (DUF2384 family)